MAHELGDDYIRRIASFIRNNEKNLAEAGFVRRRRPRQPAPDAASLFNPLGWFGADAAPASPVKPIILSIDTHHLFYLLMRLEALGIDIGTLDVRVDAPSRPMSYINLFPDTDKSETLSLASFRSSLSAVSSFSLGGGWWGKPEQPSLDSELKYIYSSFTKLPALSVTAPGRKMISELANEPPNENAIPLNAFKNLQSLECVDIDPRSLLGWDRLAESLRSLKIKKSGLEDISDIFIGAVLDDQARRDGSTSRKRHRRIPRGPERRSSFYSTQLPNSVPEDEDGENPNHEVSSVPQNGTVTPLPQLSSLKWAFLKHLSLADNALAFFPAELIPHLTSLVHLDLSSNLLVSVPSGLGSLYNLVSLNLSDNMIDSVLGIYLNLGQVLHLNLSHNRLESICGLERLHALERVDLRYNSLDDCAEIGRLAPLPNITEVWVEGNPFTEDEGYRIPCFDFFWKEGKTITLDGSLPGFYEKRNLTIPPPEQMSSSRPLSVAYSPPTVAVGHAYPHSHHSSPNAVPHAGKQPSPSTSTPGSPHLAPVGAVGVGGKARRKKVKRIVDLDGNISDGSMASSSHRRTRSDGSGKAKAKAKAKPKKPRDTSPLGPTKEWSRFETLLEKEGGELVAGDHANLNPHPQEAQSSSTPASPQRPARPSKHVRHHTDLAPVSPTQSSGFPDIQPKSSNSISSQSLRTRGSHTLSFKSAARRARVTASVYEPATLGSDREDIQGEEINDNADAYRRKIEALKKDMGDGWLKVFSQTQMKATTPPSL
ncbi:leucine-rich protein [Desarmillaria tabescens]|uniref:Leucine-rich protein n=1 Tax=Armillaria tabescens TaxID=1929756 RepID=A0AA39N971_ARMTA|nr:leucine-rich protein [Desarmillaria tabescens]KAK0461361.1 leucine-rich protein [Desarmillaria tabescens]